MATTLTIYEYTDADRALKEPIEPAHKRTISIAMGAYTALDAKTRYVTVKATGGTCTVRTTRLSTGADAAADDFYIPQNGQATFPVVRNTGATPIYVTAT